MKVCTYLLLFFMLSHCKSMSKKHKKHDCNMDKILLLDHANRNSFDKDEGIFYFIAHPDDWQLFMGAKSFDYIKQSRPLVFIYLSSGDSGRDATYWPLREKAAIESFKLVRPNDVITEKMTDFGDKKIYTVTVGNSINYFLRLTDGLYKGDGFPLYNHQTLLKLYKEKISTLKSLDGKNSYTKESITLLLKSILILKIEMVIVTTMLHHF